MALVLLGLFLLLLLLGSIILGINLPPPFFVTPRHCPGILIPVTSHKAPFLVSMPVHPDPNALLYSSPATAKGLQSARCARPRTRARARARLGQGLECGAASAA